MTDEYGRERQAEVYVTGTLTGEVPSVPPRYEDLRERAREALSPEAFAYVDGSAGAERTARNNREAFDRWRIVPRPCRGVAERDLSVELFGAEWPAPVALAPVGVQSIVHDEAELATAGAAATLGLPFACSSVSSAPMADVADATGSAPAWFQLYPSADPDLSASLLRRAEAAGYSAVVITVDTPTMGWRERDLARAYLPFLDAEGVVNYFEDPAFRAGLDAPPEEDEMAAVQHFLDVFGDVSLEWDDIEDLAASTDLPVVVKGVLHPDDARRAAAFADGVVVSNHGGRQVDAALPALEALPAIAEEVGDEVTVLFDSGIRRGADAFVALCLGAEAVLLGRPYVYGLALAGEDGVREVCRNLLADLDLTLALAGRTSVSGLGRSALAER